MIIELCYMNPKNDLILYQDEEQVMKNENIPKEEIEPIYVLCHTDGDFMDTQKTPEEIVKRFIEMKQILCNPEEQELILNDNASKDKVLKEILQKYGLI